MWGEVRNLIIILYLIIMFFEYMLEILSHNYYPSKFNVIFN
ncbi:hypothetical protein [Spiroplasma ixodetis]|nr:hypothetical protein [Spiroplasma ixodetis]